MAIVSRHYKIAEAVKAALVADAELTASIPANRWRIQKKAWHRNQSWEAGGHVVPVRRNYVVHENRTARIIMPVLVTVVWPGSDQDLTANMEPQLAVAERVEGIFANKGRLTAPAPLLALDALYTGEDYFSFEMSTVQPGEQFIESAFRAGYDAIGVVVNVDIIAPKRDSSLLGA